jgi:hypothetical protein
LQTPAPLYASDRLCAPWMCVPGAMRSGFFRRSRHGPREEKLMMSIALFAPVFRIVHPSVPVCR